MKTIYLMRGLPGSGKSTYTERFLKNTGKVDFMFEADQWMVDLHGNYHFDQNKLPYCHGKCKQYTEEAMKTGKNVAVSNTFIRLWEMEDYFELAEKYEYEVVIYRMTNNYGSVHGVPDFKLEVMRKNFQDLEGEILI